MHTMRRKRLACLFYIFSVIVLFALIAGTVLVQNRSIPGYRIFLFYMLIGALLGWLLAKKAHVVTRYLENRADHKIVLCVCIVLSLPFVYRFTSLFYSDNLEPLFVGRDAAPRLIAMLYERLPFNMACKRTFLIGALIIAAVLAVYALTVALYSPMLYYNKPLTNGEKYLGRLKQALLPCTLLGALIFFFGPWEVFFQNPAEVDFAAFDFLPTMLLIWLIAAIALACLVSFLPRRFWHLAVSLVFGVAVCGYLQVLLLNLNVGNVNQTVVDWGKYTAYARINTAIWIALIVSVLLLEKRALQLWKKCISFVCILIFGMQLASITALAIQADKSAWSRSDREYHFLSGNDQYTVGRDGNVIILCLDAFENFYMDRALVEEPASLAFLKDFTYYNNYDASNAPTQPSITCMLTGDAYDTTKTWDAWCYDAWHSKPSVAFYGALARNGYAVEIYADASEIGSADDMAGLVSNVFTCPSSRLQPDRKRIVKGLTLLSLYRLCPFSMKNRMAGHIPDMSNTIGIRDVDGALSFRTPDMTNYGYYDNLASNGFCTVDGNRFIFQYLLGAHVPYDTNADCRYQRDVTIDETMRGCMTLLEKYIEQLKSAGVYDDATIIITADHGGQRSPQPVYLIKRPG